jgi:hypothetical protein
MVIVRVSRSGFTRLASLVCAWFDELNQNDLERVRQPSRGEADRLPRPGVYALLAGAERC